MDKLIIDYRVIVRQINTDFFGNATSEQAHFESAAKELLNKGYVPHDELKTTSGSAGGFFASSQYPTMAQAFVLYGTAEEKIAFDEEQKRLAEQAEAARVKESNETSKLSGMFAMFLVAVLVWLLVSDYFM